MTDGRCPIYGNSLADGCPGLFHREPPEQLHSGLRKGRLSAPLPERGPTYSAFLRALSQPKCVEQFSRRLEWAGLGKS